MKSNTRYWLFKSEPDAFSIDDLKRVNTSLWDGVRNFQVRNLMRDEMKVGDKALFYHSSCKDVGVVGEMEIVGEAKPDPTQFDPKSEYFDKRSKAENPLWLGVTVGYTSTFPNLVPLSRLRTEPSLKNLTILRKGNRLSITEITKGEYERIVKLSTNN
ncbi:MAG: EVE domain-containing protein [Candidatus Paceibacteria bacterium]